MHVVIYGVGAIGGFYGAMLAKFLNQNKDSSNQISFVARNKTLETLKTNGIRLERSDNNYQETIKEKVQAVHKLEELDTPVDVVLVCVKSKDTEQVACDIAQAFKTKPELKTKGFYAVSIQNGVENEERLAKILGKEPVVGCLTNVAAENIEAGVYAQKGQYSLIMGEFFSENKKLKRLEPLIKLLQEAGINASISEDIVKDMWTKLVWNAGINPISALHRLEIAPLFEQHKETIMGIMQETKAIAHALGIMIRDDVAEYQFNRTNVPAWANFKTSMLQDRLAGKEIELDELLGIIVRKGKELKIATPQASKVYEALKAEVAIHN